MSEQDTSNEPDAAATNPTVSANTDTPETQTPQTSEASAHLDSLNSDRIVTGEYLTALRNAEELRAGRNVSDIPLDDPYWEARNIATKEYLKTKEA